MPQFPITISFYIGTSERRYKIVLIDSLMFYQLDSTRAIQSAQVTSQADQTIALTMFVNEIFNAEDKLDLVHSCLHQLVAEHASYLSVRQDGDNGYRLYDAQGKKLN